MTLPQQSERTAPPLRPEIPADVPCPVAKNLELLRRVNDLSGAEMARRLGVDPMTFYRYRTQGVIPPWDRVVKAARAFDRPPEWFYTDHTPNWIKEGI